MTSDRVDIGVFANNGAHWSAPAFISLLLSGNEKRIYRADGQIAEADYASTRTTGNATSTRCFSRSATGAILTATTMPAACSAGTAFAASHDPLHQ